MAEITLQTIIHRSTLDLQLGQQFTAQEHFLETGRAKDKAKGDEDDALQMIPKSYFCFISCLRIAEEREVRDGMGRGEKVSGCSGALQKLWFMS